MHTSMYVTSLALVGMLAASATAAGGPGPGNIQAYHQRRDTERGKYEKQLHMLARTALQNGLGEEALMYLREIVTRDPDDAKAKDLSRKLEEYLKRNPPRELTDTQRRTLQRLKDQMNALVARERAKYVAKLVSLARWCRSAGLADGLRETIAEGLALDADNVKLRTLNGQKLHAKVGWLRGEDVDRLDAGLWMVQGLWEPWKEVSEQRIEELKQREADRLGPGFRYMATFHFTIANDLADRSFEHDMQGALELLVREQYREFYTAFRVGLKPYNVLYFNDNERFAAYARRYGGAPGSMGYYHAPTRTFFVWRCSGDGAINAIGTAFHELAHLTLNDYMEGRRLPIWLDEGFASFHEKSRPKGSRFCFGPINVPRMHGLRKKLEDELHVSIGEVLSLDGKWKEDRMYVCNLSAMFMHFLYGRGLLRQFLHEMKLHGDGDRAAGAVLGPDRASWDVVFDGYVREELLDPGALRRMREQMKGTELN